MQAKHLFEASQKHFPKQANFKSTRTETTLRSRWNKLPSWRHFLSIKTIFVIKTLTRGSDYTDYNLLTQQLSSAGIELLCPVILVRGLSCPYEITIDFYYAYFFRSILRTQKIVLALSSTYVFELL